MGAWFQYGGVKGAFLWFGERYGHTFRGGGWWLAEALGGRGGFGLGEGFFGNVEGICDGLDEQYKWLQRVYDCYYIAML